MLVGYSGISMGLWPRTEGHFGLGRDEGFQQLDPPGTLPI